MRRNRHAKIVATVGPASASPDMLKLLFLAGVDVFRLNFSHGTQGDHAAVHAAIRDLEREVGRPIGILQDLQGPKIRIGTVRDGSFPRERRDRPVRARHGEGGKDAIPLPHPEVFEAIAPGQEILIDDGRVRVSITGVGRDDFEARVTVGGVISNRKGVNLPGPASTCRP